MSEKLTDELLERIEAVQEPLEPARHLGAVAARARLVDNMRSARQEIAQMFLDIAHWNEHVRRPDEARIDPDPDGDLGRLAEYYDRLLKHDVQ